MQNEKINKLSSQVENLIFQVNNNILSENEKKYILLELEKCLNNLVELNQPKRKFMKLKEIFLNCRQNETPTFKS